MSKILKAPWTEEHVKNLQSFQKYKFLHPYTCGGNRKDKHHLDGEGILVPTVNGWICPYCSYTQDTCHESIASQFWETVYEIDWDEISDIKKSIAKINMLALEDLRIDGRRLTDYEIQELKLLGLSTFTIIKHKLWEEVI